MSILGKRNCEYESLKTGACLVCSNNSKEAWYVKFSKQEGMMMKKVVLGQSERVPSSSKMLP